jgi:Electron transfer flavoprotein domain
LAVLEQREGKLNASSLGAITAAQKIGGSIHGFVAGPKSVAEAVAKVKGLEKVLMVDNSAYDKVGHPQLLQIEKQPKQKLIYCSTGATRKLRPLTSRKHQEGRVYTYHHRPFSIWEEYPAQSSCIARCSANLGCYVDWKRRQYATLQVMKWTQANSNAIQLSLDQYMQATPF